MNFSHLGTVPLVQQNNSYGYEQYPYQQQQYYQYQQPYLYNSYNGYQNFMNPPTNSAAQYYGFDPYSVNTTYQQQQYYQYQQPYPYNSYNGYQSPMYSYNNYYGQMYSDMYRQQAYQHIKNPVLNIVAQAEDDYLAGRERNVYYVLREESSTPQNYMNPYNPYQEYYNSIINGQKILIKLKLKINGEDYSNEAVEKKLYEMMYPQSQYTQQQLDPELIKYNERRRRQDIDFTNASMIMSLPGYPGINGRQEDYITPIKKQMLENYQSIVDHHNKLLGVTEENKDTYSMVDYFKNVSKIYLENLIIANRSKDRNLQNLYNTDIYQQTLSNNLYNDPYHKPMAVMKDNTVYIPRELAVKKDAYNEKRAQFINQILNVERSGVG